MQKNKAVKKIDSEGPDPDPYQAAKFDPNQFTAVQVIAVTDRAMDRQMPV